MRKYLFIVLLVGVWSCEDEDKINPLIGNWDLRYLERIGCTNSTLNYRISSDDENFVTLIFNEDYSYEMSYLLSDRTISGNTDPIDTIAIEQGIWNTSNDTIWFEGSNTFGSYSYDRPYFINSNELTFENNYCYGQENDFSLIYLYDKK